MFHVKHLHDGNENCLEYSMFNFSGINFFAGNVSRGTLPAARRYLIKGFGTAESKKVLPITGGRR
jgi:hypothetical protein